MNVTTPPYSLSRKTCCSSGAVQIRTGPPRSRQRWCPSLPSYDRGAPGTSLHPCMARLLDEFGDREDVLDAVGGNIHSYFGWGSPTEYFVLYETPLSRLRSEHPSARVRALGEGHASGDCCRKRRDRW